MKSLFLAWQAQNRAWFPVGRLDADVTHHHYYFGYTKGAMQAHETLGFAPLPAFPDFQQRYESSELFPLFQNRVMNAGRKDFAAYLASLDLPADETNPIEILAVSGGERQTDSLEVFPRIQPKADGSFRCRFFVHGWRHMTPIAQARALSLQPEEKLGVCLELNNPVAPVAIMLTSLDYSFVGWTPRYLVPDFLKALSNEPKLSAKVVRVNADDVPANRRVLVELSGTVPSGVQLMSSEEFQLVTPALAH